MSNAIATLINECIYKLHNNDNNDFRLTLDCISYELLAQTLPTPSESRIQLRVIIASECLSFPDALIQRIVTQYFDSFFRLFLLSKCGDERKYIINELNSEIYSISIRFPGYSSELFRGASYLLRGERIKAFACYQNASRLAMPLHGLPRMYLGANSVRADSNNDWLGCNEKLPAISESVPVPTISSNSGAIIVLSCDISYFCKFGQSSYESIRSHSTDQPIPYHVIGEAHPVVPDVIYQDQNVYLCFEKYKYKNDRTYFATARFYRALEFICKTNMSLYISDVDNIFIREPELVLNLLAKSNVGLRFVNNSDWFPWWGPSAGSVYISNKPGGRHFANLLRQYISKRLVVNGRGNWWFDQLALNEVSHYICTAADKSYFINLTDLVYHLSIANNTQSVLNAKRIQS